MCFHDYVEPGIRLGVFTPLWVKVFSLNSSKVTGESFLFDFACSLFLRGGMMKKKEDCIGTNLIVNVICIGSCEKILHSPIIWWIQI